MDVIMDDSISFCEEFVGKLGADACRFCLPKDKAGVRSCMGYHHAACEDGEVASIYVVYCHAASGKASPEDVAAARKALQARESVADPGLLKKDPDFESPFGCIVPSCGLEFYNMSVTGMSVYYAGTLLNAEDLLKNSSLPGKMAGPGDAYWSDPELPADFINKEYNYVTVSVGNFVYAQKRTGKKDFLTTTPVNIMLCRHKGVARWMQYVDRKGRMYRFTIDRITHTEKTLLMAANILHSLGIVIIADALSAGNSEVLMSDTFAANVASYGVFKKVRRAVMADCKTRDFVTAVMPSMANDDALRLCNKALLRASAAHLKSLALAHL
jgi:hypothetical protein